MPQEKPYRFMFIAPFRLTTTRIDLPKEQRMQNFNDYKHLLYDVEWDHHPGALTTFGDWEVENRSEQLAAAAERLKIVREVCETGKWNAVLLVGGTDPGYFEAQEIAKQYHVAVTTTANSQMQIACMLGLKFTVIHFAESSLDKYYNLILQYQMVDRCASIRMLVGYDHPNPGDPPHTTLAEEREKALRGQPSKAVDQTVNEAVAAIEEDGAEVIIFGCSGTYWMQPFVQKRLNEMGWDIPVLEGNSSMIVKAKLLVSLGRDASGLMFPPHRPKYSRRKKLVS